MVKSLVLLLVCLMMAQITVGIRIHQDGVVATPVNAVVAAPVDATPIPPNSIPAIPV
jgi:hypothetical protein